MIERAFVPVDELAERCVVLAQDRHDLFGLGDFGECRESAQVAEHHRDVAAMALQHLLVAGGKNEIDDLRREKSLEPADPLDLGELLADALLERLVPAREVGGLLLHLIVQLLLAEHRFDAREKRHLVDRLAQIFVGPGLETGDDVLGIGLGRHQDDRHERQALVGLQLPADFDAVDLRHHHVEQDEIGTLLAGHRQGLFAVRGLRQLDSLASRAASPGCRDWSRCRPRRGCAGDCA